ncbi:hypothetical protein I8D67_000989 [Vibrio parahaemolyticus]|uniref:hypothetical protein n=1 Tax=Vibrio parahaemolyticus TaxID=670 RepID=UPI00062B094C|nr:hypothetical protein [Vibrio parahaemolyticus]EGQ9125408.1 hypothetical protein [Vibrio parahaemolyticus]EGR1006510.1 hypothetical protein [Vibrio parahaemolyticus]EGR1250617.1 hypothetical protein [Vibrio parahaemolyticus]EGR3129553.1 hypothetical protein [Vibrio parahaemolyticus]EGR9020711.1 hypothetical protein [Vibrio parahaemolyticus]
MPVTISISDDVFRRLEGLAVGFDTPERVIERLLDLVEESGSKSSESKPSLTFVPDEAAFKNELIARKKAQVVLHLKNGERDVIHWNASRFQPSSNLRANLWSGILRNWKDKGITSAELSVLPRGHNHPDDNTDLLIAIAGEVHWTLEEVEQYFVDYDMVSSDDGHPYYYLATFSDETPDELKQIAGLNSSNQLHLGLNIVPDEDQGEFE